jgi:hypothetical protein
MGFYDNFQGGLIGGGKQNEFAMSGIQTLGNSSTDIVRGSIDLHLDAANPSSYPGTGTTWTDLSGNARNGTLTNGPTFTSDLNGSGGYITLDGNNDYITLGTNFNFTTESFSFATWVRFISFDANGGFSCVLFWKGNYQVSGYYCEVQPQNGAINFVTNQSGTNQTSQATYQPNPSSWPNKGLMPDDWYHICITRSGTSVRIYLNGIDRTSTVGTHTNPATASANSFEIGRYQSSTNFPNVRIASFIIYQKALTAAEVLQNFNASRKRFGL